MNYLNDVRSGDIWITNCTQEDAFGYLVTYQAEWPDHDVWIDVPKDMTKHEFSSLMLTFLGIPPKKQN